MSRIKLVNILAQAINRLQEGDNMVTVQNKKTGKIYDVSEDWYSSHKSQYAIPKKKIKKAGSGASSHSKKVTNVDKGFDHFKRWLDVKMSPEDEKKAKSHFATMLKQGMSEKDIQLLAGEGQESEMYDKFKNYKGFDKLNDVVDKYF